MSFLYNDSMLHLRGINFFNTGTFYYKGIISFFVISLLCSVNKSFSLDIAVSNKFFESHCKAISKRSHQMKRRKHEKKNTKRHENMGLVEERQAVW